LGAFSQIALSKGWQMTDIRGVAVGDTPATAIAALKTAPSTRR